MDLPPTGRGQRAPWPSATRGIGSVCVWLLVVGVSTVVSSVASAPSAQALSPVLLAHWQMNEPAGATTTLDSSGNGIHGTRGAAVQSGYVINNATAYHWDNVSPTAPPPKPERLVQINDSRLNPGSRDFAITVRFRTTRSYGNMIQKGQSQTPGGQFKWEIPSGRLTCLFRSRDQNGNVIGEKSVKSPLAMPLNDGAWHVVRCEKTVDRVTMTIDGTTTVQSNRGFIGSISNSYPVTIGGKLNCDQVEITCDYFTGDMDWVKIEVSSTNPSDTQPPTPPGRPSGVSNGWTTTDLSWSRSTDDVSSTLQYQVYQDGQQVGMVASSAEMVAYQVTGLQPGSIHTYSIVAVDLAGNASPMGPVSDPIATQTGPIGAFVDDFSSGFLYWNSVTGMSLDASTGNPSAPSLRAQAVSQEATTMTILPSTFASACVSFDVNATELVSNSILMRLRTGSSDVSVLRLFVDSAGSLRLRSDVSGAQSNATVALGLGAWRDLEVCGSVGPSSSWSLYRDGVRVLNGWVANTGTAPIGRIELGDFNARTWSARFDAIVVDGAPGETLPVTDLTPPSAPGQPTGTSPSAGEISIELARIHRPGAGIAPDHLSDLPRRGPDPDRRDDHHELYGPRPRARLGPHLRGGRGRCRRQREPQGTGLGSDHGVRGPHAAVCPRPAHRDEPVRG